MTRIVAVLLTAIVPTMAWAEADYSSPIAVVANGDGSTLYVAEYTANRIAVVDAAQGKVTDHLDLPFAPTGLAIMPDGSALVVTGGGADGQALIVGLDPKAPPTSIKVGHTPVAPVVSPDGATIYVGNKFNHNVSIIDVAAGEVVATAPVTREPSAAAVTNDGARLFVLNLIPRGSSNGDYVSAKVTVIDTASRKVAAEIDLPNGSSSLRGICVSPDDAFVYVTHILGRYHLPTSQLERGWINTNALTILDAKNLTRVDTVLLDDPELGAANPWAVACTGDGSRLVVAHAGTHELSVIDRAALHEKVNAFAESGGADYGEGASTDLTMMTGIRRRVPVTGNGPRSLAVVGDTVYAAEYFTDSLSRVAVNGVAMEATAIPLRENLASLTPIRLGERLFHDGSICFQQWQSCTSCHPDTRADALNWDLLNDGIGNPKNTKSLVSSHATPPAMITGIRASAEVAVRAGIRHILFARLEESEASAIDAYLASLEPVAGPGHASEFAEAVKRGEMVFEDAGCYKCHDGDYYTDMGKANVGTGLGVHEDTKFDTPTLREIWRTGPYLHDGRAATLRDVVTKHNEEDRHGETMDLSETEIDDLVAYLETL